MYSNQSPPLYTTRHYVLDPPSNPRNNYSSSNDFSRSYAQPYPYYTNNQQPATVTYMTGRPNNYGQQTPSYVPPSPNRHTPTNNYNRNSNMGSNGGGGGIEKTNVMSNDNPFYNSARTYEQNNTPRTVTSITSPPRGGGGAIEKTNVMSNENPFYNSAHPYEQNNTPRTVTSITSPPRGGGGVNKTLNLSDENPFHSVYGGYRYPAQIDPSKRITTQHVSQQQADNKSLNLSDENPFFSVYGKYHYPSQIDPSKRITELPKASGPLMQTNELSEENPFSNYRPPAYQNYSNSNPGQNSYGNPDFDWNRNNNPAPLSYRPVEAQRPSQNYYNERQASPVRSINPPSPPPPQPQPVSARFTNQKPNNSAPLDKSSLNMSPDNPFAETHGRYYYPSTEEIKSQRRAQNNQQRINRFNENEPVKPDNTNNDFNNRPVKPNTNNDFNSRPVKPANQMTEYPEPENKDVISGKGNTKYTRFDVNF